MGREALSAYFKKIGELVPQDIKFCVSAALSQGPPAASAGGACLAACMHLAAQLLLLALLGARPRQARRPGSPAAAAAGHPVWPAFTGVLCLPAGLACRWRTSPRATPGAAACAGGYRGLYRPALAPPDRLPAWLPVRRQSAACASTALPLEGALSTVLAPHRTCMPLCMCEKGSHHPSAAPSTHPNPQAGMLR